MEHREVVLTREKETKGTWRYAEQINGVEVFKYLYIQKGALGNPAPQTIRVTVEPVA